MKTKLHSKKWYDIGIEYLLYSLVIVVPAIFLPHFYTAFTTPKLLALRFITLAILLLWGLKVFVEGRLTIRKSRFNWLLLTYGFLCVISTVYSSVFYTSLYGAHGRFLGIVTILNLLLIPFLIWNFLNDKEKVRKLLIIAFIGSAFLALYGVLQYFGVWQEQFNWNQDPADRIFGTVGHGNHFGAYLGMNFVLGVFLSREFKNKWSKFAVYAGLFTHAVTIVLTASRGSMLAVIVALGFCGMATVYKKAFRKELHIGKWLAPVFVLIAILISGAVIFKDDLVKVPLIERTAITVESIKDGKIPDRYSWWLSATEMAKDRPFLGYGLSSFRDIYNEYRRLDYETVEEGDQEVNITPEAAHNEYLNIAATQGLLGLIAWLALLFFVMSKLNGALFEDQDDPNYYTLLGLKGALIVYLVQVFFSFGVVSTLTAFFVYMGAALVLASPDHKDLESVKNTRFQRFANKFVHVRKYTFLLIILLVIGFGSSFAMQQAMSDFYYKAAVNEGAKFNLEGAVNNFSSAITLMPHEYAYQQALGDYTMQTAQPVNAIGTRQDLLEKAVHAYKEALKINSSHPSIYYNLGSAQIQLFILTEDQSYYDEAEKNLEESITKSLNNPIYPYQVAKVYMTLDDKHSRYSAIRYLIEAQSIREGYRDTDQLIEQVKSR